MHSLPTRYLMRVVAIIAIILGIAWFYAGGHAFGIVSYVCYGFVIGYCVAFIYSRVREKSVKTQP